MIKLEKNFICAGFEKNSYEKHMPAPLFRRDFDLKSRPDRAEIVISGLGFYQLYINGRDITKGLLAPYISNSDHIVYYDWYDLKELLHPGENTIGVILGNGMQNPICSLWDFSKLEFSSAPKLAFNFEAEFDGKILRFDAADCKCGASAILFDDLRSGVFYDAGWLEAGWSSPGFDDSKWLPAVRAEIPRGELKLCEAEPITIQREIKPVSVKPGEMVAQFQRGDVKKWADTLMTPETESPLSGGYIYDFGENITGIFRMSIKGEPGQKVSVQFAEILTDGKLDTACIGTFYPTGYAQRDIYICGGDGEEEFIPPFTYHGFRYAYVTGITPQQATPRLLCALVANSNLSVRGGFHCSDEDLNTVFEMTNRSDLGCFQYFPVDCPHREKNGWTGDVALSAEHMILKFGAEDSWREWLHNIRKAQRPDGRLPGIIPTGDWGYEWGNGPAWDCVLFRLPYTIYTYRGDTRVIRENAHAMLSYLEYIAARRDGDGLIAVGLGDWLPVGRKPVKAPLVLTDSIMVVDMCRMASVMFRAAGLTLNAAYAEALGTEVRNAIRGRLIDFGTMTAMGDCQTSQAMSLYYKIFEEGERPAAFARLLDMIERNDGNFDCGCLGLRVLFHVLAENGRADIAYRMIAKKDYPSYVHLISQGETTLPEMIVPDGVSPESHNHHFLGDVSHWLMRHLGGLNINPTGNNVNHVRITPRFVEELNEAYAWHELPAGRVSVSWKREPDQTVSLRVECPETVRCEIRLENGWVINKGARPYADAAGEYTVLKLE